MMRLILLTILAIAMVASTGTGASVGGKEQAGCDVQCDLPFELQMRNRGGNDRTRTNPMGLPGRGSGLCVFTSIEHAARYQNVPALIGFQEWMTRRPGGGHPQKVDEMIAQFCKERGFPVPPYINIEGWHPELMVRAAEQGRMPCVTYGWSPTGRYGGQLIDHMVNLFGARPNCWIVLDNNFPASASKPNEYERLDNAEWKQAHTRKGSRKGWTFLLLSPPPPPPPIN